MTIVNTWDLEDKAQTWADM